MPRSRPTSDEPDLSSSSAEAIDVNWLWQECSDVPPSASPSPSPSPLPPALIEGEILLHKFSVSPLPQLGDRDRNRAPSSALATLTSHRLIYCSSHIAQFLHLALVVESSIVTPLLKRAILTLKLEAPSELLSSQAETVSPVGLFANLQLAEPPTPAGLPAFESRLAKCLRSTRPRVRSQCTLELVDVSRAQADIITQSFIHVLKSASWLRSMASFLPSSNTETTFSPARAGIGGIIRTLESDKQRVDNNLQSAMHDLNDLMKHAQELLALADRVRAAQQSDATQHNSSSDDVEQISSVYETLGVNLIANPTERSASDAKSSFHLALAQELSTLLCQHAQIRNGQMMSLADVYCLYNRARGVALISPDECLKASRLLREVDKSLDPLSLHQLDTGTLVICRASTVAPQQIDAKLISSITKASIASGLTSWEASEQLGIAHCLIQQRCIQLEQSGKVCRDDSLLGPKLFINRFPEFIQTIQ